MIKAIYIVICLRTIFVWFSAKHTCYIYITCCCCCCCCCVVLRLYALVVCDVWLRERYVLSIYLRGSWLNARLDLINLTLIQLHICTQVLTNTKPIRELYGYADALLLHTHIFSAFSSINHGICPKLHDKICISFLYWSYVIDNKYLCSFINTGMRGRIIQYR